MHSKNRPAARQPSPRDGARAGSDQAAHQLLTPHKRGPGQPHVACPCQARACAWLEQGGRLWVPAFAGTTVQCGREPRLNDGRSVSRRAPWRPRG
jgi:hypothetical protein